MNKFRTKFLETINKVDNESHISDEDVGDGKYGIGKG